MGKPGCSADAVRKQYLALARRNYPDVNGGDDSKMKAVNIAYEVIQAHGHMLDGGDASAKGSAPTKGKKGDAAADADPNRYKKQWKRAPRSATADATAWNTRSEFDWGAAVGVTAEERADGRNHPQTFNPFFSFD